MQTSLSMARSQGSTDCLNVPGGIVSSFSSSIQPLSFATKLDEWEHAVSGDQDRSLAAERIRDVCQRNCADLDLSNLDISSAPPIPDHVKHLNFSGCSRLSSLECLNASSHVLQSIDCYHCTSLKEVPASLIAKLTGISKHDIIVLEELQISHGISHDKINQYALINIEKIMQEDDAKKVIKILDDFNFNVKNKIDCNQEEMALCLIKIRAFFIQDMINSVGLNPFGRNRKATHINQEGLQEAIAFINAKLVDISYEKQITEVKQPISVSIGDVPKDLQEICTRVMGYFKYSSSMFSAKLPIAKINDFIAPIIENKNFKYAILDENPENKDKYLAGLYSKSHFKNAFFSDKFDIVDCAICLAQEAGETSIFEALENITSADELKTIEKPLLLLLYKYTKNNEENHEFVKALIEIQQGKITPTPTHLIQYHKMIDEFIGVVKKEQGDITYNILASMIAVLTKYGNCASQSYMAAQELIQAGYRAQLLPFSSPDHVVAVAQEKKNGKAYIIDPWAGIVCEATASNMQRYYNPNDEAIKEDEDGQLFDSSFFASTLEELVPG